MQPRRYHPLIFLIDVIDYIKGAFIPALFLFVVNRNSDTFLWKYGRYLFIFVTVCSLFYFIVKWLTHRYELKTTAFHLYTGIFRKEEQVVPYTKIQNMNQKTSLVHKLFHMTSLHFETAMSSENATVSFKAITKKHAEEIENFIQTATDQKEAGIVIETNEAHHTSLHEPLPDKRVIHFSPTNRDTLRASFTSFSFLVLIPLLFSIYANGSGFFNLEKKTEGFIGTLLENWWMIAIVVFIFFFLSFLVGLARIYFKYGKYEISSDLKRIYIKQGVLNESSFSIAKEHVQAIEMEQSLVKRMLGMVEIKLISAGNLKVGDELEISSLYPFLKKKRAYSILTELLPTYQITEEMTKLTKTALGLHLFKGSLFYLVPAVALVYFKPTFWGMEAAWGWIILILFLFVNINILFNHFNSAYSINDSFIQFKKGAFGTNLFLSKRKRIIEVYISQSLLQKRLSVATIEIVNRAQPIKHTKMADIPIQKAVHFHDWYKMRMTEVELER